MSKLFECIKIKKVLTLHIAPPSRRSRKQNKGKSRAPPPEASTSEEESSDGGSVTRCVCGDQHNVGLMVQCDKCEVWQHCDCVGLTEEEIPDHYYCDLCKPENHQTIKTHGRVKRAYQPIDSSRKRQSTISDDAGHSAELHKADSEGGRVPKRRKRTGLNGTRLRRPASPVASIQVQPGSSSPESLGKPSIEDETQNQNGWQGATEDTPLTEFTDEDESYERRPRSSSTRRTTVDTKKPVRRQTSSSTNSLISPDQKTRQQSNGKSKQGSRPSTPLADDTQQAPMCMPYWNDQGRPNRESSPPAKVKYPNPKMTLVDMNRRAKQILDYVGKLQLDLAGKKSQAPPTAQPYRPRSFSTSSGSSLSSASTVPLLDEDDDDDDWGNHSVLSATSPTTPIPFAPSILKNPEEETAVDIMDRVTRELMKFQRKFGVMCQPKAKK
ncbi:hypothetical protein EC973_003911 [Apophysomyces ossiformis]|uniref:PHD-type domain-containing protein n=1 Tax=Apophysomyces ossiformis TaxID=679940 RepID=A0A8H7BQR8_9FUNG|nr:hypothetical protein EC973_003911 [Apophysomyces ossiformis]